MDLISRLCAGTLLGLRDATAFAPTSAGVEDQDQAQDGQQKGDHTTLRGGGWHLEQRYKKKKKGGHDRREKTQRRTVIGENRYGEFCQVKYRSK